jgi:hypothetical protein
MYTGTLIKDLHAMVERVEENNPREQELRACTRLQLRRIMQRKNPLGGYENETSKERLIQTILSYERSERKAGPR